MINYFARHWCILITRWNTISLLEDSLFNLSSTFGGVFHRYASLTLLSNITIACGASNSNPIRVVLLQYLAKLLWWDYLCKGAKEVHADALALSSQAWLQGIQLREKLAFWVSGSGRLCTHLCCLLGRDALSRGHHHCWTRWPTHGSTTLRSSHASGWRSESHIYFYFACREIRFVFLYFIDLIIGKLMIK